MEEVVQVPRRISWFLILMLAIPVYPQGYVHTEAKKIIDSEGNELLIRSMGLGGWMIQEGYMLETSAFAGPQHEIRATIEELIGKENTDTFYTAWLNNHVRRIDIDSVASWGFNAVRLPMHYNLFSPQDLPVGQYIETGFQLVDSLLAWCAANQMYLILDMHGAPGGQGDDAAISDYDPAKPSLWESEENKARAADLWKTLAARYANEEWIGGYDLINEPKWDALLTNNNQDLWELLQRITDSIRTVDNNHMIIIEGNMWANDYTGFAGPWDNNMTISFHKYWNTNNTGSIQWMLDMRNQYNTPIWLGETGENSNTWFVELIELMEENSIGYSFWPEKKFSSVVGPVTVIKTEEYQQLLDYWTDPVHHSRPDTAVAKVALMQMTENLKLENCRINRDVIDAFSREVNTDSTISYQILNLPGIIHAVDYDMGKQGFAYFDTDYENNGNATYNNGGNYRNDGVDIESCNDALNSNGFDVGWTSAGEWMKYTVNIDSTAGYTLVIRYAGMNSHTGIHFTLDSLDITGEIDIPSTGAWNVWDSLKVNDVILSKGTHALRIIFDAGGCNLSWFEFIEPKLISEVPFKAISAETNGEGNLFYLTLNKDCKTLTAGNESDFSVLIGDVLSAIQSVTISPGSEKILILDPEESFDYNEQPLLSYQGSSVQAEGGQELDAFSMLPVHNNLPSRHVIPGKIEAEDYIDQSGIVTETTTDAGAGLNIGYTDAGDYLDYLLDVRSSQLYQVNFRVASLNQAGGIQLILYDEQQNVTVLGSYSLPVTGGWQTWQTKSGLVDLPAGFYTLRLKVVTAGFNLNWLSFTEPSLTPENQSGNGFKLYPNPCRDKLYLYFQHPESNYTYQIDDLSGRTYSSGKIDATGRSDFLIDTRGIPAGLYVISLKSKELTESALFSIEG
jgi:endoglucanase